MPPIFSKNESKKKQYFWGRKAVSEKRYFQLQKRREMGKNIRKIFNERGSEPNQQTEDTSQNKTYAAEGRRIVNVEHLAKNLHCKQCTKLLDLENIVDEKQYGLACVFVVKCIDCNSLTRVPTDSRHLNEKTRKMHFDTNTKAIAGVLNSGIGHTHLNKLLTALNMPSMHWDTFKIYEKEVGQCIEKMAEESCKNHTLEEKRLTLVNLSAITKLLPPHLQEDFIVPEIPNGYTYNNIHEIDDNNLLKLHVRIFGLFDMGWTTKASGKQYDSKSGTGTLFGYFTNKVLSYANLNRKCKSCDQNVALSLHDCKKNFEGTAKAMEPHAATKLVCENPIFKEYNIEVGIFGADNDSSAIAAIRKKSKHEIIKLSDKNHTSKGVVSELYRIKKLYKELNGTSISFLQKCFNYAVSQCNGDSESLAKSLRAIPNHCFNLHNDCGNWCKFRESPDSYKHSTIGQGFTDKKLFDALVCLFDLLASKAKEFASSVSTNVCENMNGIICSYAPKSRLYGMSASGSYRTSCAINSKNEGTMYMVDMNSKLNLSPGRNTVRNASRIDLRRKRRHEKASTIDAKKRRLQKKKEKAELKNKRELSEGVMYQSNYALLKSFAPSTEIVHINNDLEPAIVIFDLETGGLALHDDILQIAAKSMNDNFEFSLYVEPTKMINPKSSLINKLYYKNGLLEYDGNPVITVSLEEAMNTFYNFLCLFKKKVILCAHNCKSFDAPRLISAFHKTFMSDHFKSVISAFCDTMPIIKKFYTKKSDKGGNKLENVAKSLDISAEGAHDAACDVDILIKILLKLKIKNEIFIKYSYEWLTQYEQNTAKEKLFTALLDLEPLKNYVSLVMLKRMVAVNITYSQIVNTFKDYNFLGIKCLLGKDENGAIKVTESKLIVQDICDCLEGKPKKVTRIKKVTGSRAVSS